MKLEKFQQLPIGTILVWTCSTEINIEVKVSNTSTRILNGFTIVRGHQYSFEIWDLWNYKRDNAPIVNLKVAPKYIQKLYEIK